MLSLWWDREGSDVDSYLVSLCREYVEYVDAMRSGQYSIVEIRQIDSQRQIAHDELCRYTGYDRNVDMYAYAKRVLYAARGGNIQ